MTPGNVIDIGRQAVETALMVSAPLFGTVLVLGLIISIFQAATSINEATLTFVPKMVAAFVVLIVAGPWMITLLTDFTMRLYESIPGLIG